MNEVEYNQKFEGVYNELRNLSYEDASLILCDVQGKLGKVDRKDNED